MEYCVYLTIYFGKLLPKRYIGSSKISKIKDGYNGSISSKKFSNTYHQEQRENKHLFKSRILSVHSTRKEAFDEELRLQILYDVVKDKNYMNMSYASPKGAFGNVEWVNHPNFGKKGKEHHLFGKKLTPEHKHLISLKGSGLKKPKQSATMKGRKHSESHCLNISKSNKKPKSANHVNSMINSELWKNRDKKRKAIIIEEKYYHTIREAAISFNTTSYKIHKMAKEGLAEYTGRR